MNKIYVWIKEPNKKPRHVYISNTLKNLQNNVGGYIEHVPLSPTVGLIVNEEGLINAMPYNCTIEGLQLFGTIIWVGYAGEEFGDCPLDNEEFKKYYPELFKED